MSAAILLFAFWLEKQALSRKDTDKRILGEKC